MTYYLYGTHACLAALSNKMRKIFSVEVTNNFLAKHKDELKGVKNIKIVRDEELTAKLAKNTAHQGILVKTQKLDQPDYLHLIKASKRLLLLDQIADANNIGSMLRSCAAFGFDGILNTKHNSFSDEAVIAKVASGAFESIPYMEVVNLAQTIENLKENEFWIVGLCGTAKQSIREVKGFEKLAVVIGSEGDGMRQLTKKSCDILAKIPISNNMESLNAAIAAAIALYEVSN